MTEQGTTPGVRDALAQMLYMHDTAEWSDADVEMCRQALDDDLKRRPGPVVWVAEELHRQIQEEGTRIPRMGHRFVASVTISEEPIDARPRAVVSYVLAPMPTENT